MNKVILIGRLTKDPEIRVTQSGKKVASFSVAIDDGKDTSGNKISQYFNCSAWDSLAEIIEKYVKKGYRVSLVGKLQNRSWEKSDGTKGYATDISVRELEILTSRSEAEHIASETSESNSNSNTSSNSTSKPPVNNSPDDIPEIDVDSITIQMPF